MDEWIEGLTDQQVKALASQCGVVGWASHSTENLVTLLKASKVAKEIYEEHYGQEASVQEQT